MGAGTEDRNRNKGGNHSKGGNQNKGGNHAGNKPEMNYKAGAKSGGPADNRKGLEREKAAASHGSVLERLCTVFVQLLFGAVLLFLIVISATTTCRVYGGAEKVQYGPDQPVVHILLMIIFLAAGVWFYRKRRSGQWKHSLTDRQYRRLIIAMAGFYLVWLLFTMYWPNSDQRMAMESARSLLAGDYSPWDEVGFVYASPMVPVGYAYTYPSQNGLILFLAVIVMIFRDITPYAVQILNIGFLFGGVYWLSRLAVELFGLKSIRGLLFLTFGCLPFAFYITFVYGTMPGFCFSSAALYFLYRYIHTDKIGSLMIASLLASASVLLKSNYLIVLVALIIYLLSEGVFRKRAGFLAAAVLMAVVYMGSGKVMNAFLENVTGKPVSGGIPMTAWVEMGLQEGSRGPGWYNGYNVSVFAENDEDTEKTKEAIREDLMDTVSEFGADPEAAADFFLRKAESVWAEPTFQSLWIQEVKGGSWLLPGFTDSLLKEGGILNKGYMAVSNWFQTFIYAGALLFLLSGGKRTRWEQLIPAIIFIGGFLFHMAWEGKGQYTVCYFILLIPYAFTGIGRTIKWLSGHGGGQH